MILLCKLRQLLNLYHFNWWCWRITRRQTNRPHWPANNTQRHQLWRKRQRYHQHHRLTQSIALYKE